MSLSPIKLSIFQWYETPEVLKFQIDILSEFLVKDKRVVKELKEWKKNYTEIKMEDQVFKGKELRKILTLACIYKNISAMDVSQEKYFQHIYCYNDKGVAIVKFDKIITEGNYVKLFRGYFLHDKYSNGHGTEKPIAIKLHESRDGINTTRSEINIYRDLGDPSPSIGVNAYLWNIPVLLMYMMAPLDETDDENIVGVQILQQLAQLHLICPHSDLKVLNIMKEIGTRKPQYKLIDFGGCPREKLQHGFKRRTWSSKWTVQKKRGSIITPKIDLLELGHTLTALKYVRAHPGRRYPNPEKRTFTGRLKKYMEYTEAIDDVTTKGDAYGPHYKALTAILNN